MGQRAPLVIVGTLALLLAGACGAGGPAAKTARPSSPVPSATATPAAATPAAPSPASSAPGQPCQSRALTLGYGPRLSPAEEEQGDWYTLNNHGSSTCLLAGYPAITLYHAGGAQLGFHYTQGARHSEFVTSAPPGTVILRPGASAWILVAKLACTGESGPAATAIRVTMPGRPQAVVTGPATAGTVTGESVSSLNPCLDSPDPGQYIAVSPIEPTRLATIAAVNG